VTIVEEGKEKESTGDGPGRKRQTSTGEAIDEPAEDGAESEASADGDETRSAPGEARRRRLSALTRRSDAGEGAPRVVDGQSGVER
jgi:hypothetical protein